MVKPSTENAHQITESPFTKEEQIKAILNDSTQKMVRDFAQSIMGISSSGFFQWLKTVDASAFFVVTAEELYQFVASHGFPPGQVEENGGLLAEGKFVIDKIQEGYYETYAVERGKQYEVQTFSTLSEARTHIIRRMMTVMRVRLNL